PTHHTHFLIIINTRFNQTFSSFINQLSYIFPLPITSLNPFLTIYNSSSSPINITFRLSHHPNS
ncbi:hypothetical protein, partial [Bacillus pumilus]|uniref:hypothetical protein n=1 Tax=Bacillus pumilus TaxID=1408 RepID=UPI001C92C6E5